MNRAERRRLEKAEIKKQTTYTFTKETLEQTIKEHSQEYLKDARMEVMIAATAIIFVALNDKYGFSSTKNGKGKLDVLTDVIVEEFNKMDESATEFCYEYYVQKLREKTGMSISK